MQKHELAWTAPQPFWTDPAGRLQDGIKRPQILRFATDDFMQELMAKLEQDPVALTDYAVYKETWRGPSGAQPAPAKQWLEREPKRFGAARRGAVQRARAAGTQSGSGSADTAPVLKLYQPAHLRHYLVGGSLVCQTTGLPDRVVDPARHKVAFVVRRLFPRTAPAADAQLPVPPENLAEWDEHAFVLQGKAGAWRKVADAGAVLTGEERLALFPTHFVQDDGHGRRLYVGNVPVGKREAYQGAAQAPEPGGPGDDPQPAGMNARLVLFHTQVLARWKALVNQAMRVTLRDPAAGTSVPFGTADLIAARPDALFVDAVTVVRTAINDQGAGVLRAARSSLQTASWYLLLDLADFLQEQFGATFLTARPGATAQGALYDALNASVLPEALTNAGNAPHEPFKDLTDASQPASLVYPPSAFAAADVTTNLIAALRAIAPFRDALETATSAFSMQSPPAGWPNFLFLFADPWFGAVMPPEPAGFNPPAGDYVVEKVQARIDALVPLMQAALVERAPTGRVPEPALATMQPTDMREAWYALRLVYERPDCAPFEGSVVSDPTVPFQMAGFFDPDAPARPIRIGLPVDISPAGLRKFDKNTAFMLSDMLCGQMDRMKGIGLVDLVRSVLPWPLHKDLDVPEKGDCKTGDNLSLGVMCSLSIPIVTICALILLLIIASILDYIFRWMPYLIACFPLPGFKARKEP